ncbi:MAG: energy transducer TonB [Pseudomonadota bacterium]
MPLRSLTCALILLLSFIPHAPVFGQEDKINAFYQGVLTALASQSSPVFPIDAETLIAFTVAEDGTLESAEVAQSSGSDPLDQTALQIVRDAAPFPVPPDGANRSLSITIKSTRPELGFGNLDRLRP